LISPVAGFVAAGLLLLVMKLLVRKPELYQSPKNGTPPPLWIRALLIFTCTGVSFAHGSNDGQKGMGLIMLILVGIMPTTFALNLGSDSKSVARLAAANRRIGAVFARLSNGSRMDVGQARQAITVSLENLEPGEQAARLGERAHAAVRNGDAAADAGRAQALALQQAVEQTALVELQHGRAAGRQFGQQRFLARRLHAGQNGVRTGQQIGNFHNVTNRLANKG